MNGVGEREREREREKARETSLDRAKSVFYFLTTGFIPFHRTFSRYKMLTYDYTGLALHHFDFLGKAGFFLLSYSIIILSTRSSGLGAINILCRSGDCKPIFRFHGDLN